MAPGSVIPFLAQVSNLLLVTARVVARTPRRASLAVVGSVSNAWSMLVGLPANSHAVPAVTSLATGLLIPTTSGLERSRSPFAAAGGAWFPSKLDRLAHRPRPLGTRLTVASVAVTVLCLPLALPVRLPGDLAIDSWQVLRSLIVVTLLPLAARTVRSAPECATRA